MSMLTDPAGLLQRVPELEAVCTDPRVRAAVESGDPFKVYRALWWGRLTGRLARMRATVDALLANRRVFARPLGRSPTLGTFNTVGTSFVGSAEADADGTEIATHCVVVLMAVPLLPLGAYIVKPTGDRSWEIFARVPMSGAAWLWSRGVALATVALLALGAAEAFVASRHADVWVVNGFDVPLEVSVGEARARVGANGAVRLRSLPVGAHEARAVTESGLVADALTLELRSGLDVQAWNVAGATPLFHEILEYSAKGGDGGAEPPPPDVFCGQRVVSLEDVDHAFEPPPATLRSSSERGVIRRSRVGIADVKPGYRACLGFLSHHNRLKDALPFLEAHATFTGWPKAEMLVLLRVAHAVGSEEALRIARQARDATPESVFLHRAYQSAAESAGKKAEALEEYRRRAAAEPSSGPAQYLYARLLPRPEREKAMRDLVTRFPGEPNALRTLVWERYLGGAWEEANRLWESLEALSPEDALEALDLEVGALVGSGRARQALELLVRAYDSPHVDRTRAAELYTRVALLLRAPRPEELLDRLEKDEGPHPIVRAHAGLLPDGEQQPASPAIALLQTLASDPAAALDSAERMPESELVYLPVEVLALLAGEAARTGRAASEAVLERAWPHGPESRAAFRRYVTGEPVAIEDLDLDLATRAAAMAVRARNPSLPAGERQVLVARARRDDVLHGWVSTAIDSWPP